MRIRITVDSQAFAQMSKAFVISPAGTVDDDLIAKLQVGPEGEAFLRSPEHCGGSVIVGPDQRILAGPLGAEEGIIYADCDLERCVAAKLRHDFAGHYDRPDIFQLRVNMGHPRLFNPYLAEVSTSPEMPAPEDVPAAAETAAAAETPAAKE
jgi:nitrilase